MTWVAAAVGFLLAGLTLLGPPIGALAFFGAPLAFASICIAFAPGNKRRESRWLLLAGAGSFACGFLVSMAVVVATLALRLDLPRPVGFFSVVFPGALAAALVYVRYYSATLGLPRPRSYLPACVALAICASVVFCISGEIAAARPWLLDRRIDDNFYQFSGPYIIFWFIGLALLLKRNGHGRLAA